MPTTITRTGTEDTVAAAKTYEQIKAVEDAVNAIGQSVQAFDIQNFSGSFAAIDARKATRGPKATARRTGRG